jgi:protein TonB
MADVLIVCVREDELQAKALADMFERAGFSVGGAPGSDGALRSVGAGVVVWSQASIRSRPFLDAAQRVIDADKAVIASLIDPPPAHTINNAQAFALEGWTGDPEDASLDPLFFAVDRMVTSQRASVGASPPRPAQDQFEEPPSLRPPPAYNRPRSEPPQRAAPTRSRNPEPPPARTESLGAETEHWRAIRDSKDPADFLDYLARYGANGAFSEVADIKLKQLTGGRGAPTPPPVTGNLRDAAKSAAPQRSRRLEAPPPPVRMEPPRRIDPPPPPPRMEAPRRVEAPPTRREPLPAAAYRRDYDRPPPEARDNSARKGGMVRLLILALLIGGGAYGANYFLSNQAPSEQSAEAVSEDAPPSDVVSNEPLPEGNGVGGADVSDEPVQLDSGPTPERAAPLRTTPPRQQPQQQQRQPQQQQQQQRPTQQAAAQTEDATPAPRTSWANEPATTSGPASLLPGASAQPQPQLFASNTPPPAAQAPRVPAGQVVFAQRPSARRIADLYPARASRDGVGGRVQLDCVVRGDLGLSCSIGSESPGGQGFGAAALSAAGGYRAQASLSNGQVSAGSRARIVIVFQPPAD